MKNGQQKSCVGKMIMSKTKQTQMTKQRNASIELKTWAKPICYVKKILQTNKQEARNNVNIVNFTPQQQQQKTPDQLFLNLGDFMKGEIETMTKTADKKTQTKKHQIAQRCK